MSAKLQRSRKAVCKYCRWFTRCDVHWGMGCTQKGGKRVPRERKGRAWTQT